MPFFIKALKISHLTTALIKNNLLNQVFSLPKIKKENTNNKAMKQKLFITL